MSLGNGDEPVNRVVHRWCQQLVEALGPQSKTRTGRRGLTAPILAGQDTASQRGERRELEPRLATDRSHLRIIVRTKQAVPVLDKLIARDTEAVGSRERGA